MAWRVEAVVQVRDLDSNAEPIPVGVTADLPVVLGLAEALRLRAERDLEIAERADPALAVVAQGHLAELQSLVAGLLALAQRKDAEAARVLSLVPAPVPTS